TRSAIRRASTIE
nr:Chain B, PLN [Homo sapiens]